MVVFAGGLGAQLIQVAAYFHLKNAGQEVYADTSYFDRAQQVAVSGSKGELSHWAWQLECFGLSLETFPPPLDILKKNRAEILRDGERMMDLGLNGLAQPDIQALFKAAGGHYVLPADVADRFLCIHVRRGDYVNVASHLITDDEFFRLMKKFSGLVRHVVVISDSPIETEFQHVVSSHFEKVVFLDDIDTHAAHCIMRHARILFCSNSTFSLTAAALNPEALVIIPRQWFSKDLCHIEAPIHKNCLFEIMENGGG